MSTSQDSIVQNEHDAPLDEVPLERLESEITELAAHINAATCRWLLLVAEFDRRRGWGDWECRSCAHWLNWKCGIDLGAARERVRVARALGELPDITASFAAGQLSFSKVRALTRVATLENEAALLEMATQGTAAHLERIVRAYRKAQRAEELDEANRIHEDRTLQWRHDEDGSMEIQARLTPEQGALVRKALEQAREAEDVSAETSGDERTHGQRNADALMALARSFLAEEHTTSHGGDSHLITVHVDAEVLAAGVEGRCELEDGPAVAVEVARRLGCDASVVAIVEDGQGNPLDVGRKTRTIPPALRRALRSRYRGCRFPGCTSRRFVDGHHVRHWSQGGETSLSNLVSLCRRHHRAVHEGGYAVEPTSDPTRPWAFRRPDGTALSPVPPASPPTTHDAVKRRNGALGLDIGPATAVPGWYGERLDLGLALDALFSRERRRSPASAVSVGDVSRPDIELAFEDAVDRLI